MGLSLSRDTCTTAYEGDPARLSEMNSQSVLRGTCQEAGNQESRRVEASVVTVEDGHGLTKPGVNPCPCPALTSMGPPLPKTSPASRPQIYSPRPPSLHPSPSISGHIVTLGFSAPRPAPVPYSRSLSGRRLSHPRYHLLTAPRACDTLAAHPTRGRPTPFTFTVPHWMSKLLKLQLRDTALS